VAGGFLVVVGVAFLPRDRTVLVSFNVGITYALIAILYLTIRFVLIPRHVGRDVLSLLKKDREFE
jgi:hypothetical protein